ncbi:YL1 nuclear protein-domain-containing protein [Astrocystis sublimbata]|nr:YL1 nuclear protein-domain-containing protein [Astrocystis sublimbata]
MATPDQEQRMRIDGQDNDRPPSVLSDSDSDDDLSGDEKPASDSKVEWLATSREKRSTAGNRMKSMIAAEEPDDELELLFAEDADDAGFTEVEDDGSDAHMSSSEDEDAQENADDLEGEKELEQRARESKQAARKRKAQEAIPVKFRKKVRIDTSQSPSAAPVHQPRPRKKSERLSWLPTVADMPTRASRRETTMAGKEQLHKQMAEREVKRLQQVEAMERKAKKMAALKKPPMTQAQRLAEAALVEKRNAKSLNRWEEAEKQREEERKAKLAALNNRTLEGPVVTFWSGVGEWIDGKLKHVGKIVTIEEKPAKKKRHSTAGTHAMSETTSESHEPQAGKIHIHTSPDTTAPGGPEHTATKANTTKGDAPNGPDPAGMETGPVLASSNTDQTTKAANDMSPISATKPMIPELAASTQLSHHDQNSMPPENTSQQSVAPPTDIRPPDLKPPDFQPPAAGLYTTSMFAPPSQSSLMMPPELKPPSNSFLAPPAGVSRNGLSMPVIGYHSSLASPSSSNFLAPPKPAQRQSPLSMPQTDIHPPPPTPTPTSVVSTSALSKTAISTPGPIAPPISLATPTHTPMHTPISSLPHNRPSSQTSLSTLKPKKTNVQKQNSREPSQPPPPSPSPPADGKATRNCIILQNFNENAVKDRSTQTRILFNREFHKLPKPGPVVRCVITNHPAKYRDPKTGLPYYNTSAFKQLRKLYSGEYKWSSLVGAWAGSGDSAARGVPARFLDPNAPAPPKEQEAIDLATQNGTIAAGSGEDAKNSEAKVPVAQIPVQSAPQPSPLAAPVIANPENSNPIVTTAGPSVGPSIAVPSTLTGAPSSGAQPYIPTTAASFELNTNLTTTVDTPMSDTNGVKVVEDSILARPADVANTTSGISQPLEATMADPQTSSSAPSMLIENGAASQ